MMIHTPVHMMKMFAADVVLYATALYWCWTMEWQYAFAGLGAFTVIYLTKAFKKMVHTHRVLKQMDEELRREYGEE